jgi:RNA polymerase sigma-70 factor, ECF subfamily
MDGDASQARDLSQLIVSCRNGDKAALDEMSAVLYQELRRLAGFALSNERGGHTLQPTSLVHEAYLKLVNQRTVDWRNRAHFLAIASQMMRRILINYAEARNAGKRGGDAAPVTLQDGMGIIDNRETDLLELNGALDALTKIDPQQGNVVELRFFGGLSIEETAEVLKVSPATVKREWATARIWLLKHLRGA